MSFHSFSSSRLGLAALRLERLELLSEVVGEDGAEGRVVGDIVGAALGGLAVLAQGSALDVPRRGPDREEDRLFFEDLVR